MHRVAENYVTALANADDEFPTVELLVRESSPSGEKSGEGSHLFACRMYAKDETVLAAKARIRQVSVTREGEDVW